MKIKVTREVDVPISPYCKNCLRKEKDKTEQYFCTLYNRYLTEARSNFLKCRECYIALYEALESEEIKKAWGCK